VEILSGLKPGETVVTEGSDRLADGIPVEIVTRDEPKAASGGAAPPPPPAK
jgi:multidrug efflux system membrane fusion protein